MPCKNTLDPPVPAPFAITGSPARGWRRLWYVRLLWCLVATLISCRLLPALAQSQFCRALTPGLEWVGSWVRLSVCKASSKQPQSDRALLVLLKILKLFYLHLIFYNMIENYFLITSKLKIYLQILSYRACVYERAGQMVARGLTGRQIYRLF